MSPAIVSGLLRGRLGFGGVISTDAMIMGGAGRNDAEAAVDALAAGCDLICYPGDAATTIGALERAASDPAFEARLNDATSRATRVCPSVSPESRSEGSRGSFEPVAFARDTIVGDREAVRGWRSGAATRVVGVSDDPAVGPPAGRAGALGTIVAGELRAAGWRIEDGPAAEQCIVVLAATPRGWKGRGAPSAGVVREVRALVGSARRGLVVLLGHARWLETLGAPGICAWSTETVMERAAAAWLRERTAP